MARIRFTKAAIERLPIPATGRTYTYDDATPSLAVCVTATGHRAFYLYKRVGGRPERIHIGPFPDLTVEQARRKADELKGEIAQGQNPAKRNRDARGAMTFGELFERYIERAKSRDRRTWAGDQRQFDCHLSGWKARKLATITRADVARLHAKVGKTAPYSANRLLALLSTVFNVAANFGFEGANPCKGIERFPEKQRDRFLQPHEMKPFFDAIAAEPDGGLRDFFWLVLLSGARRGNVQSMCWSELDLTRGEWTIPGTKSKNKKAMPVRLPPRAVEILTARQADNAAKPKEKQSGYVFPSFGATGHLVETKSAWARIRTAAKLPDLRVHDLRHTHASWQGRLGASLPTIGASLGHSSPQTTARYTNMLQAPIVAESVDRAAIAMLTAGGILPAIETPAAEAKS